MPARTGDPLRISATDWFAVQTMLRSWRPTQGQGNTLSRLPCLTAVLRPGLYADERRPVWGEAVSLNIVGYSASAPIAASLPIASDWEPTEGEEKLLAATSLTYATLRPRPWTTEQTGDLYQPWAICVDPRGMKFAIGGMAMVRVRFHSRWHLFVRRPILLPGEGVSSGSDDPDVVQYTGILDSSGSGPGQIVGVLYPPAVAGQPPTVVDPRTATIITAEAPHPVVWAVIRW